MLAERDEVVAVGAIAVQEDDEMLGRAAGSGHDAGTIEFLGRRSQYLSSDARVSRSKTAVLMRQSHGTAGAATGLLQNFHHTGRP